MTTVITCRSEVGGATRPESPESRNELVRRRKCSKQVVGLGGGGGAKGVRNGAEERNG